MFTRSIGCAALLVFALMLPPSAPAMAAGDDGIVRIKSAYSMPETIKRIKKDVADKGIMFFDEIDQSKLAADAASPCARRRSSCSATLRSERCS